MRGVVWLECGYMRLMGLVKYMTTLHYEKLIVSKKSYYLNEMASGAHQNSLRSIKSIYTWYFPSKTKTFNIVVL